LMSKMRHARFDNVEANVVEMLPRIKNNQQLLYKDTASAVQQ